ncbi:MAG TPA: VCBS repeat-containing protein, partial [Thermoanaerobaculia bacterium]|nr:VCBS repeat-containing protein [Thermoanaerobaculia bacterium]
MTSVSRSRAASATLPSGFGSDLTLVRFDGGASLDVLWLVRSASNASRLEVLRWRGRGDGTFQAPATILAFDGPFDGEGARVLAGDLDGDRRTDVVVSSMVEGAINIYMERQFY